MKLAIVIGHSKDKKGALATLPLNQYEYDYNTDVAQFMFRFAMNENLNCKIFTRDNIGVVGAYKAVSDWAGKDPAVCIELHFNAADTKARGTETLFDNDPLDCIEFARDIHQRVCSVFKRQGKQDRGIKLVDEGRGAKNLAECKIVGCLIEPFFGDNKEDAALGLSKKVEYAKCLVEGVKVYFYKQKMN